MWRYVISIGGDSVRFCQEMFEVSFEGHGGVLHPGHHREKSPLSSKVCTTAYLYIDSTTNHGISVCSGLYVSWLHRSHGHLHGCRSGSNHLHSPNVHPPAAPQLSCLDLLRGQYALQPFLHHRQDHCWASNRQRSCWLCLRFRDDCIPLCRCLL